MARCRIKSDVANAATHEMQYLIGAKGHVDSAFQWECVAKEIVEGVQRQRVTDTGLSSASGSKRQWHNCKQQHTPRQAAQEGEKGEEERDKWKEERKGEGEVVWGREYKKVDEAGGQQVGEEVAVDVMDWLEVKRSISRRTAQRRHEGEGNDNCRMGQVFVKVDGSKRFPLDVSL